MGDTKMVRLVEHMFKHKNITHDIANGVEVPYGAWDYQVRWIG